MAYLQRTSTIPIRIFLCTILLALAGFIHGQEDSGQYQEYRKIMKDLNKNSMQLEYRTFALSGFYERLIPVYKRIGITCSVGISSLVIWGGEFGMTGKLSFLYGGAKHFFELLRKKSSGIIDFALSTYIEKGKDWWILYARGTSTVPGDDPQI